jgi:prepilin peptidase CpaA
MKDWPLLTVLVWTLALCGFTVAALVTDLRSRRIPNALTVSAFALALAFHLWNSGLSGLGFAFAGFGVGFGVMLVLWLIGGGGGGDVKLMGAVGTWVGVVGTTFIFLGGVLVAIIMTVGIIAARSLAPGRVGRSLGKPADGQMLPARARGRTLIPFAVPVCVATWGFVALKVLTWTHG